MNIRKKIKKKQSNIDCLLVGGSGAGVSINPIAFLVIQESGVKLMPVNYTCSLDKILDYIPDIVDKANGIINKKIKQKENQAEKIINQIKKNVQEKEEKENTQIEYEYDETMEDD